jgi:hypothetical protein
MSHGAQEYEEMEQRSREQLILGRMCHMELDFNI